VIESLAGVGPGITTRGADVIVRDLTLRGEESAVVIEGGRPVLERLVFEGVRRERGTNLPRFAIAIGGRAYATVRDTELNDSGDILVHERGTVRLEDNALNDRAGILIAGAGASSVVIGNTIVGARLHGIEIVAKGRHRIGRNTIIGAESSDISVGNGRSPGVDPLISDNTVTGSSFGISVASLAKPTITRNDIIGNDVGISTAVSDATISLNRIMDGDVGLATTRHNPVLSGNLVEGNVIGILVAVATYPVLEGNVICMNGTNMQLLSGVPAPDLRGNEVCPDE
jgi:parallel beta-helix repeat protein